MAFQRWVQSLLHITPITSLIILGLAGRSLPATLSLTALPPAPALTPPDTLAQTATPPVESATFNGTLTAESATLGDGSYLNEHFFDGRKGQTITIDMTSESFDAYLILLDPDGNSLAEDSDSLGGTNAQIIVQLPATGRYTILANAYVVGATGTYQVQIRAATATDTTVSEANQLDRQANQLYEQGRYAEAIPFAEQALQIREAALGDEHPAIAESLNTLAGLHRLQGNYETAESLYERSLQIREATLEANHPDIANSLNNLALLYQDQGNDAEAQALLERSLQIAEASLGANHSSVSPILNNLADLYRTQRNYAAAEPLLERSLQIAEQTFGENHPEVAITLNNLAGLYQDQQKYADAIPLYERSLRILEENLGETHPDVATSLNNLADLYREQGDYSAAASRYERSLQIRETRLGENHPDVAWSLNNLALVYQAQGRYAEAEALLRRSLQIQETALGENHPDVAVSLNNLAGLYQDQGNYVEVEPLYQRALRIREQTLSDADPAIAASLNNLAGFYETLGNAAEAEALYRRSLPILEQALGENHPDVAISLNNLALLYQDQGNYAEAEPLLLRSLRIRELTFGENHPDVAVSLNNLAILALYQGNLKAAEPLIRRSLRIRELVFGENHPLVANSLENLAALLRSQGNLIEAQSFMERSLHIQEQTLGANHPSVALSLKNLAVLYQHQGDDAQALSTLNRALAIEEANLNQILSIGSETRKRAYLTTLQGTTDIALSFHLQAAPTSSEAAAMALTTILRRKGRVLEAVTDTYQHLRQNLTAPDQSLLNELQNRQAQLATLIYGGLATRSPAAYQAEVTELRSQIEALENTLAQRSAEFRVESEPVTLESVAAQIPANGILIEWVQYRPFDPHATEQLGDPHYAAYLLDAAGTVQWVNLGDAATIDHLMSQYRDALRRQDFRIKDIARQLDAQVMEPVRRHVGEAQHLLLSPDGQLNLIPFAALVDESDRYLIETYTLTYLTSGRDLLRLQLDTPSRQPPVLIANPNYDLPGNPNSTQLATAAAETVATRGNSPVTNVRSTDLSAQTFGSLPGTEQEANAILPLLPNATLLTGTEATENSLKQLQGPSILHIATHGFFFRNVEFVPPPDGVADVLLASERTTAPQLPGFEATENQPVNNENPLLRSGLALAGFNPRQSGREDGVLTALEASGLDLRGTQLVVLSACDTGLGDVINGEGVYGLRRAFVMAGAESQLMSLWKVDDYATSELMSRYYQRLQQGETRSDAFRQVQLELLQDPDYQHPYFWAAFIFSGDWRLLSEP